MPRTKGALNKNKQGLQARLQREFPEYHAVIEMARIANDPENDLQTRFNAHKEVAKYVTPQLKAVDLTVEGRMTLMRKVKRLDGSVEAELIDD